MGKMDFKKVEKKWQAAWEKDAVFSVKDSGKNKLYVLEMFPYPSSSGLHMGHAFNYTIGDIYARFKRMNGFNVLYPMGYDSFGLPAENAAIKSGEDPKKFTENAIKNFIKQQKGLGLSYDWSRLICTHEPEYYRWNEWFFLKFFEKRLAYRRKGTVNWCSSCATVLANEQVHDGKCWRCENEVEDKELEQWFINQRKYAEELLKGLGKVDWPERVKAMQEAWIGKSEGTEIIFSVDDEAVKIFTTRPDTLFGVTFMVFAPEHPLVKEWVKGTKYEKKFGAFLKEVRKQDKFERTSLEVEKKGMFIGKYAVNPVNGEKVPVYVGNFVVLEYGAGAVMAVPAHDQRDFEFARKYGIDVRVVISPDAFDLDEKKMGRAYVGDGKLVNSGKFSGLRNRDAIDDIAKFLKGKKKGGKKVEYKLRDWLVSRQRYWGTPIPIVYCEKCGTVPVPYKDLPVKLPPASRVKFGKGNPLDSASFVNVKCPKCGGNARRETDTMDTFFDSSWYFLRYADARNSREAFSGSKAKYWMPVDQYIGGVEHACMHLIYARFFVKALRDLGLVSVDEPFLKLFNQGMLHGDDGAVMSKSRGNVVLPEDVSDKYGIDTARLFLVSVAGVDKDVQWSEEGIAGSSRFLNKVVEFFKSVGKGKVKVGKASAQVESKLNLAVKNITQNIENFEYNLAVIELRELFRKIENEKCSRKVLESFLKLLSVFCPHVSEELWEGLGKKRFLSLEKWPQVEAGKIDKKFEEQEKMVGKTLEDIRNLIGLMKEKGKETEKVYVYVLPKEVDVYSEVCEEMEKSLGVAVSVFSVADKKKYDPEKRAAKAKPLRPAVYLE